MTRKEIRTIFAGLAFAGLTASCQSQRPVAAGFAAKDDTALYEKAIKKTEEADYHKALALFNELEKEQGINEELTFQKQRIYLKLNEIDSASFEIKKLIGRYPENLRYYALLAKLYSDHERLEDAIQTYQSFLEKYPGHPKASIALAVLYKRNGNDSAFQETISKVFTNPHFDIEHKITFVTPFLKYVEIDPSERNEALRLCRYIVQTHPRDARAYALSGNMFLQCRLPDSAISAFKQAIRWNTGDQLRKEQSYTLLAQAYSEAGKQALSDSCYDFVLQMNPKNSLALNNYSYQLAEQGKNLNRALQMSEQALRIQPRENTYQDTYAWILFKMGKYEEAKIWMEKALAHPGASDHPLYLQHYGHILYQLGDTASAKKYWKLAREKKEKNSWYENK